MKWVLSFVIVIAVATYFSKPAHAIILLPAIVLIPIAKLVVIIIGGLAIPAFGSGYLWSVLSKKSFKKTFLVVGVFLLLIAIGLGIGFKLLHPDRPII